MTPVQRTENHALELKLYFKLQKCLEWKLGYFVDRHVYYYHMTL